MGWLLILDPSRNSKIIPLDERQVITLEHHIRIRLVWDSCNAFSAEIRWLDTDDVKRVPMHPRGRHPEEFLGIRFQFFRTEHEARQFAS